MYTASNLPRPAFDEVGTVEWRPWGAVVTFKESVARTFAERARIRNEQTENAIEREHPTPVHTEGRSQVEIHYEGVLAEEAAALTLARTEAELTDFRHQLAETMPGGRAYDLRIPTEKGDRLVEIRGTMYVTGMLTLRPPQRIFSCHVYVLGATAAAKEPPGPLGSLWPICVRGWTDIEHYRDQGVYCRLKAKGEPLFSLPQWELEPLGTFWPSLPDVRYAPPQEVPACEFVHQGPLQRDWVRGEDEVPQLQLI